MNKKNEKYLPMFISIGMLAGIVFGVVMSFFKNDFGLWLSIGTGSGIALGALFHLFYASTK